MEDLRVHRITIENCITTLDNFYLLDVQECTANTSEGILPSIDILIIEETEDGSTNCITTIIPGFTEKLSKKYFSNNGINVDSIKFILNRMGIKLY